MSEWLAQAGHDVNIIAAQPAYKPTANIEASPWRETVNGVNIRRVLLFKERGMGIAKIANTAIFILRAFFIILFGPRRDVIMAGTTPPVLQGWFLSLAARLRGSKFVYHMQDIHPEIVSFKDGKLVKGRFFKLFQKLDITTIKRTNTVVVIGSDMADVLVKRGADVSKIKVINNFALDKDISSFKKTRTLGTKKGPVKFIFAGNIGIFQNLESLVEVFSLLDPHQVRLVLVGEGRAKDNLMEMVENQNIRNVEFHDHMSQDDVFNFLCGHDVGLVSLLPGLYRYAFPSKIWTYLAADLPMLAMVENNSQIADMLKENNFGTSIDWNASQETISDTIMSMAQKIRRSGYSVSEKKHLYHSTAAKRHWIKLFDDISVKCDEQNKDTA